MTADDGKPSEARLMTMASLIRLDCFLHQVGDTEEARREGTWGHIGRIVHHCTRTDARSPYRDTYDVHFGAQVSFRTLQRLNDFGMPVLSTAPVCPPHR